jgi:TetR/AcrR family transcriptional regulator, ethionamide resistance regulator
MPPEPAVAFPAAPERRRPTRGDRRRRAILDAVEGLLRDRSIAALSVEDVAETAGIARSGFYFYFESKYAALGALLAGAWEDMAQAAGPFFAGSDEPPATYVPRTIAAVDGVWRTHEHLLVAMVEASATDSGARDLWEAWIGRFVELTAARIDAERAAGRAPAGPPARWVAEVLLRMNERSCYAASRRGASRRERDEVARALAAVWLATVWGERSE